MAPKDVHSKFEVDDAEQEWPYPPVRVESIAVLE